MTKLSDEELNKRVHEIMEICQHKWEPGAYGSQTWYHCDCGDISSKIIKSYNFTGDWQTSAYEFGLMFEFMQKHERWEEFVFENGYADYKGTTREDEWIVCLPISLISPRPFAEAMCEFFKEES